jgi:hypothetical protein
LNYKTSKNGFEKYHAFYLIKNRYKEEFLWLDKNGYVLERGADFMAAEKINSYPVKVYRKIPVRFSEEFKIIDKKQSN